MLYCAPNKIFVVTNNVINKDKNVQVSNHHQYSLDKNKLRTPNNANESLIVNMVDTPANTAEIKTPLKVICLHYQRWYFYIFY